MPSSTRIYACNYGINKQDQPGHDLNGCVPDVKNAETFLRFSRNVAQNDIITLIDHAASLEAYCDIVGRAVAEALTSDWLYLHCSGHGTQMVAGDAASDGLCMADFDAANWSGAGFLGVDRLRKLLGPAKCRVLLVTDACHSGNNIGQEALDRDAVTHPVSFAKFLPIPDGVQQFRGQMRFLSMRSLPQMLPNVIHVAGCASDQTSADAVISGKPNGVLTWYWFETLRCSRGLIDPMYSIADYMRESISHAKYTQVPQIHGPVKLLSVPFLTDQE